MTLTTEPELRPYSASKVLVITRNSSIAIGRGLNGGEIHELIVGISAVDAEIIGATAAAVHRDRAGLIAAVNDRIAGADGGH